MGKRTSGRKRRARMNSPQMDMLPSEKIDARFVDSSPEIQSAIKKYNDFWGALSDAERAKLKKLHKMLVRNVKRDRAWITSDDRADYYIRKTAEEVHVDYYESVERRFRKPGFHGMRRCFILSSI